MDAINKHFYFPVLTSFFVRSFLIILISIFSYFWLTNTVFSATQTILEQTFFRDTGKPKTEIVGFTVPVAGEGNLKIVNGPNGGQRISSAVIILNGKEIMGPYKLNQNVGTVETPVRLLQGSNTLGVKLNSSPGGSISIQITIQVPGPWVPPPPDVPPPSPYQ